MQYGPIMQLLRVGTPCLHGRGLLTLLTLLRLQAVIIIDRNGDEDHQRDMRQDIAVLKLNFRFLKLTLLSPSVSLRMSMILQLITISVNNDHCL